MASDEFSSPDGAPEDPLDIAARKVGGRDALANGLNVGVTTLGNWKLRKVPLRRCVEIEKMSGVPCEELRPDMADFFSYLRNSRQPAEESAHA